MRRRQSDASFLTVDRVLVIATTIIGALTMIIWGIVWMNLTGVMSRVSVLEGDKRVIEQRLKSIDDGQVDIRADIKQIKDSLQQMKK